MAVDNEAAPEEVQPEPLARSVAGFIRERSRTEAKLLKMASLEIDGALAEPEQQEALIAEILADEQCRDIKLMRTPGGVACLYCGDYISDTYARILLGVEHGDPYELMAGTVREESETYPRPTNVELFRDPTFQLDPKQVVLLVDEMLRLEQYRDIKRMKASTGALYLYSDRHLDEDYARSLMEWQEVGRFTSL